MQRTGIVERRHALPGTATSDLAVAAAERCIATAGVSRSDIDFVLLGTVTPDRLIPATASVVQERLGLLAPAMDVHASCASFIYAMITGMQYVANGCSRLVLVIGADCNSRMVNPADRQTYPLFGDAAGAVLLAAGGPNQGLLGYCVGSDGAGADLLCRPMGGSYRAIQRRRRRGRPPFPSHGGPAGLQVGHPPVAQTIGEVLAASNMTLGEVDLVIFHQANMRIIRAVVEQLGLDPGKVVNNVDRYGNTSSASIPLALDEAYRQGRIRPGNHILFSGFGAGLASGHGADGTGNAT